MSDQPSNNKQHIDNRHLLRQIAIQKLYVHQFPQRYPELKLIELEYNPTIHLNFEDLSGKLLRKVNKGIPEIDARVEKIITEAAKIDQEITEIAPTWPLEQINPVDLQILRYAVYEGFYERSIPERVAIDEAIELARDFGGESNINFVSGVLGKYYSFYTQDSATAEAATD